MRYDPDEHARSCEAMLLTITTIGICKKVAEVIFLKCCDFVSRTVPIYSQRSPTAQFVGSAPQTVSGAHFGNQYFIGNKACFNVLQQLKFIAKAFFKSSLYILYISYIYNIIYV